MGTVNMAELTYENRMRKGRSAPPIACHNAGNWFTMAQTKREVVKSVEKSPKVPTNFATRFQAGRFAKRSGLSREYTFSAYDNRLEESRHTRKGLQWDHRKVYETPSFLTWKANSPNSYQSTSQASYTISSQTKRTTTPAWNRFPKVYRDPTPPPPPTFNSRQFVATL